MRKGEVDDESIYCDMMGSIDASAACVHYNERQMLQSIFVTLSKINGVAIKAANTPAVSTNTTLYLITCAHGLGQRYLWETREMLTIQRRCLFCLTEKSGAWI